MRRSRTRRLVFALLALAALAGCCAFVAAQGGAPAPPPPAAPTADAPEVLRVSRNLPGDSKPIVLHADEISTWVEGGRRVFLLQGQVLVQQGVVQARFQQGVVWVDLDAYKRTRIYHADVYAEGDVRLENGAENSAGAKALLDLNTRGELKVQAHKSKVAAQTRADDPLYRRAQAEMKPPASVIQQTGAREVVPPPPPTPVPGASGPPVAPTQGTRPDLVPPPPSPPPAGPPPPPPPAQGPPAEETGPTASETAPPPRPVPGAPPAPGQAPPRYFSIAPRTGARFQSQIVNLPGGDQALVVTGGVILNVRNVEKIGLLDIEADRLVVWTKGSTQQLLQNLQRSEAGTSRELEVYMAGNVELREETTPPPDKPGVPPPPKPKGTVTRTLRADELYYDVNRNVAVALNADLEMRQPGLPEPIHFSGVEVQQLSPTQFRTFQGQVFSSRLPSDPSLKVTMNEATLEEKRIPRRTLFGGPVLDPKTGQPEYEEQSLVDARGVVLKVEDVPAFWTPFARFDARDPLGPLESIHLGWSRIFGFTAGATLDVYDLLGVEHPPGTRWHLDVDYLSLRGPGLGTQFDAATPTLFGLPARNNVLVKAWGLEDNGTDVLGGGRGQNDDHPEWRGRFLYRQNVQDLPAGFSVQAQVSALSDKNFLEQYYKREFDEDVNQETYLYLKQQQGNAAWTLLAEPSIRRWVTETEWLPRADGYLIGQSFFDLFTYNAHVDLGFARLRTTEEPPPPLDTTDQSVSTGRFDLWQDLSLPFYLGPVKMVPYGVLDLTYYTEDLSGDDRGRVYGGGGVRASLPLTRIYPDAQSEWFNLNAINHKIELVGNFYAAESDTPFTRLPQLDRLNDDATDQALRDITPQQPALNPQHGAFLATSPLFNPQTYAIRRLVDNRVDTLDDIEVAQLELRQRWQTKRGYPGQQHIVDWMKLDLSGSVFPRADRDNFGEHWAFLEYNWLWNVGDRNGFLSSGWFDPFDQGARVFTFGAFFDRPDRTSLFLGYRQIDPINSKAVTGAVTYVFSPKYALTASSTYDFGTQQSLSNSLIVTRMGTDVQVSLGFTYNAIQNNFGFLFEILPNVVAARPHHSAVAAIGGPGGLGGSH